MPALDDNVVCCIQLLGEVRILRGTEPIPRFRTQKQTSIVAFLALNPTEPHRRDRLVDLFWPEMDIDAGRDNLSTALSGIRRHLEDSGLPAKSVLDANRQTVGLCAGAVTTDVIALAGLLREARAQTGQEKAATLEKAAALFLSEPVAGLYDEWALQAQSRLNEKRLEVMFQWNATLIDLGDLHSALDVAHRLVAIDPYREESVRALMSTTALLGRAAEALETFRRLKDLLREELGVSPSAATVKLADRIRNGDVAAAIEPVAFPVAARVPDATGSATPKLNLPAQFTRLFGREGEISRISDLITGAESVRLVTLTGPGGAGKTRLSIAVAEKITAHFRGGVWFVPLADVNAPQLIPFTLCTSMDLRANSQSDPFELAVTALNNAAASGPCLLILDNLEQLLGLQKGAKGDIATNAATLIRMLLERVPSLTCLATSRQSLRLGGEVEYAVPPLALPPNLSAESLETLRSVDAIELFMDRARAAKTGFELTERNSASIVEICRRLAGMPLAIEMAAAWVRMLPPDKLLDRMRKQLDVLVNRRADLPLRHQTMRATIAWSYELLESPLRNLFTSLSVFKNGATLEAIEYVCEGWEGENTDSIAEGLLELQSKSLLFSRDSDDGIRFDMLEPLHEFAREQLDRLESSALLHKRHAEYYARLVAEAKPHLQAATSQEWIDRLESEWENLRVMLHWMACFDSRTLLTTVSDLRAYWHARSRLVEAMEFFDAVFEHPEIQDATPALTNAYIAASNICWRWGQFERGKSLAEKGRQLSEECGFLDGLSGSYTSMANLLWYEGDHEGAEPFYEQAVGVEREIRNERGLAVALSNLALVKVDRKDYDAARALFIESMELRQSIGNQPSIANILLNLGELDLLQRKFEAASANLTRCLELAEQFTDTLVAGYALQALGRLAMETGDTNEAVDRLLASLEIRCRIDERFFIGQIFNDLGKLAANLGEPESAIRLLGLANGVWSRMGTKLSADNAQRLDENKVALRNQTRDGAFESIWAETVGMNLDQAVATARTAALKLRNLS